MDVLKGLEIQLQHKKFIFSNYNAVNIIEIAMINFNLNNPQNKSVSSPKLTKTKAEIINSSSQLIK